MPVARLDQARIPLHVSVTGRISTGTSWSGCPGRRSRLPEEPARPVIYKPMAGAWHADEGCRVRGHGDHHPAR
jgi:hypothetical protein